MNVEGWSIWWKREQRKKTNNKEEVQTHKTHDGRTDPNLQGMGMLHRTQHACPLMKRTSVYSSFTRDGSPYHSPM